MKFILRFNFQSGIGVESLVGKVDIDNATHHDPTAFVGGAYFEAANSVKRGLNAVGRGKGETAQVAGTQGQKSQGGQAENNKNTNPQNRCPQCETQCQR